MRGHPVNLGSRRTAAATGAGVPVPGGSSPDPPGLEVVAGPCVAVVGAVPTTVVDGPAIVEVVVLVVLVVLVTGRLLNMGLDDPEEGNGKVAGA